MKIENDKSSKQDLDKVVQMAIEGGWCTGVVSDFGDMNESRWQLVIDEVAYLIDSFDAESGLILNRKFNFSIFLEIEFWQALGKMASFNSYDPQDSRWMSTDHLRKTMEVYDHTPIYYQHLFIDWVNSGRPVSKFFKKHKVIK